MLYKKQSKTEKKLDFERFLLKEKPKILLLFYDCSLRKPGRLHQYIYKN